MARVEAVLRRRAPRVVSLTAACASGPYVFDRRRFVLVAAGGEEVPLSAMQVDLVAAFTPHPGRESG